MGAGTFELLPGDSIGPPRQQLATLAKTMMALIKVMAGALGGSFSLRSKRNEALVVCCLATVAQPQAKGDAEVWHGADHFLARSMAVTSWVMDLMSPVAQAMLK